MLVTIRLESVNTVCKLENVVRNENGAFATKWDLEIVVLFNVFVAGNIAVGDVRSKWKDRGICKSCVPFYANIL